MNLAMKLGSYLCRCGELNPGPIDLTSDFYERIRTLFSVRERLRPAIPLPQFVNVLPSYDLHQEVSCSSIKVFR